MTAVKWIWRDSLRGVRLAAANVFAFSLLSHFGGVVRFAAERAAVPEPWTPREHSFLFYVLVACAAAGSLLAGSAADYCWWQRQEVAAAVAVPVHLFAASQVGAAAALALLAAAVAAPSHALYVASKLLGVLSPVVLCCQVVAVRHALLILHPRSAAAGSASCETASAATTRALALVGGSSTLGMFLGDVLGRLVGGAPGIDFRVDAPGSGRSRRSQRTAAADGGGETAGGGGRNVRVLLCAVAIAIAVVAAGFWLTWRRRRRGRRRQPDHKEEGRAGVQPAAARLHRNLGFVAVVALQLGAKLAVQTFASQRGVLWQRDFRFSPAASSWALAATACAAGNFVLVPLSLRRRFNPRTVVVVSLLVQAAVAMVISLLTTRPWQVIILGALASACETAANVALMNRAVEVANSWPRVAAAADDDGDEDNLDEADNDDNSDDSAFKDGVEAVVGAPVGSPAAAAGSGGGGGVASVSHCQRYENSAAATAGYLPTNVGAVRVGLPIAVLHVTRSACNAAAPLLGVRLYRTGGLRWIAAAHVALLVVAAGVAAWMPALLSAESAPRAGAPTKLKEKSE